MKVLLTEGSGLTSRQVAGRLHDLGHTVGVLSSDRLAVTRFTRAVDTWHPVGPFGPSPRAWLDETLSIARRHRYDLLFPTQEQVTVLSWAAGASGLPDVTTIVPGFAALRAVQDKVSAQATLDRLCIPQPTATHVARLELLREWDEFPVFVKRPIGTASSAVRRVDDHAGMGALVRDWSRPEASIDAGDDDGVLVQTAEEGPLAMLQAVFDQGRLVAFHANLRLREGVRGGASHKRSILAPVARVAMATLGRELSWHGALSADAILTLDGPLIIDVNPRLVEPGNALRAGVDLVGAMVDVAAARQPPEQPDGSPGMRTHQLLLAVLGAAEHRGTRRAVMDELVSAARHTDDYRHSSEELTPVRHDWRSAVPTAVAAAATLVRPPAWEWFSSGSVANYAITPGGWRDLCQSADRPDRFRTPIDQPSLRSPGPPGPDLLPRIDRWRGG